jgi:hypothetical protein
MRRRSPRPPAHRSKLFCVRFPLIAVALPLIGFLAPAQTPSDPGPLLISFPEKPWVLQIAAPGFTVTQSITQDDGRRYLLASNETSSFVLSVTLEKVSGGATHDGCRDGFHNRTRPGGPFKLTGIHQFESGDMALLEYIVPAANNVPVNQKNLFGCLVRDDVYADIHLSKAGFKDADGPALLAIMNTARFADRTPGDNGNSRPDTSAAFLAEGSRHYLLHEFDKAIGPYQEALEREKKKPSLSVSEWRILVDNLAMAYGITGNLTASDEVLQYGLSKDPTYPMFYFIRADGDAERGDFSGTMSNLRLALKYRANMIPDEKLPDPLADDSFKAFWKNEEFKKLSAEFVVAPTPVPPGLPDFSGSYTISGGKGSFKFKKGMSQSLQVNQTAVALEITKTVNGTAIANRLPLDGSVGAYNSQGGPKGECTARFKGKSLVVDYVVTTHPQPNGPPVQIHTRERWELSSDAKTLTIRTDVDFTNSPLKDFQLVEPWSEIYTRR